ncbi:alpha/beta hydrolase [Streptomyces sp. SID13031]|uniref:alpha/beta hydrolase family protein n=1 Tax=Streptomyces sp. SID13031 TaxID=2706046 RepID=UPI0013C99CD5|nr:alpha/beta hydrolase [Streptomyces sp. SID13031]NEA37075.1 alpha/beta fold hydrolase [Streptomyces sp. SID13031]
MTHASTSAYPVSSGGHDLPGVLHLPAGDGPHPAVLLLHGFPGWERNFDLAHSLQRAGYATLVFHYRGSWGAAGTWSWTHVLEDSAAAVATLRADPQIDASRLAVIGHSMGGFAALQTVAADATIPVVGSIAGFDFGAAATAPNPDRYVEPFDGDLLPLQGTSGRALVDEMVAHGPEWRLAGLAPQLADRHVLLIGAGRDTAAPPEEHHLPLVAAYQNAEHHLFPTDHALSDHREKLAQVTIAFLSSKA